MKEEDSESNNEDNSTRTTNSDDNVIINAEKLKKLFYLPFEPVWFYLLLIVGYTSAIAAIYRASIENYTTQHPTYYYVLENVKIFMYIIDMVLRSVCSFFHGLDIDPLAVHLPAWVLVMDVISLFPFYYFVLVRDLTPLKAKLYNLVQLNGGLRIFRIYYVFYRYHNMIGNNKILLQALEFGCSLYLFVTISFGVSYNMACLRRACNEPPTIQDHVYYFLEALSKISCRGFIEHPKNTLWFVYYSSISYVAFFVIFAVGVAFTTMAFSNLVQYKKSHVYLLKFISDEIRRFNPNRQLLTHCLSFYEIFHKRWKGYTSRRVFLELLPQAVFEDICLDTSWVAYKHSKLFRNKKLPFLTYISRYVHPKFLLPGDVLYEKNSSKTTMSYLISGVVQVLSEEDGETPILSFSGGSCFGETGLVFSSNSVGTVKCKTYCVFLVLEKNDFIQTWRYFPGEFKSIGKMLQKRIEDAKMQCKLQRKLHDFGIEDNTEDLIVMWLKNTLHRLMVNDGDTSLKHECQNVYLRQQFSQDKFVDCVFTAEYLDLLAISERLELVSDSVVLKSSCPCIIQPDSVVVRIWEVFIVTLAVITSFIVPYYAMVQPITPVWFWIYLYLITIIWWLDLYVQVSIGVKTTNEILANVKTILLHKLGTVTFLIDCLAALPLEAFASIIFHRVNGQHHAILQLNRILKTWRFYCMIIRWGDRTNVNIIFVHYCEAVFIFTYIVYLEACILYAVNCFGQDCIGLSIERSPWVQLFWNAVEAIQILTAVNIPTVLTRNLKFFLAYIVFIVISLFFFMFISSKITSAFILQRYYRIRVEETYLDIISITDANGLSDKYLKRIHKYIESKWSWDHCISMIDKKNLLSDLPKELYASLMHGRYSKIISHIPIFTHLPENVISAICAIVEETLLPPNEIVCRTGNITDTFYVIAKGYCRVLSNTANVGDRVLGRNDSFAVLEGYLGVPYVNTVITVTYCRILAIDRGSLSSIFADQQRFVEDVRSVLDELGVDLRLAAILNNSFIQQSKSIEAIESQDEAASFCRFGYGLKIDSVEEFDYYNPFDRMFIFHCVQYFLLRYTILPQGKFLYYWELFRCVTIVISSIGSCIDCELVVLLVLLDVVALIDIYLKLHICYYNKDGVLVKHPLKTASHYLTHSFPTDVTALFPIQILLPASKRTPNILAICRMNRLLQIYRYFGFWNSFQARNLRPNMFQVYLYYIPLLLIACFAAGSLIYNTNCVFGDIQPSRPDIFTYGVECVDDSWVAASKFAKPISPGRVKAYAVYFATSALTTVGMSGFTIKTKLMGTQLSLLSLMGLCVTCWMFYKTTSRFTCSDSSLLSYQDSLKSVKNYMGKFGVAFDLQEKLIAHFELKWYRKRGKDIHLSIKRFSWAFRFDLLYDVYGYILEDSLHFFAANRAFLKNILVEVTHDVCLNNERLVTLNDVIGHMYILFKGRVDVIAPDGTKIVTLTPGSVFGNLDDCPMSRQTHTIEAHGHIEYLVLKTATFYSILNSYPQLLQEFRSLILVRFDYIQGHGRVAVEDNSSYNTGTSSASFLQKLRNKTYDPGSNWMKLWKVFILIIVCYLALFLELYQMAALELSRPFVAFQYFCDFCSWVNYYLMRHTAYENETGMVVRDLDLIKRNIVQHKFKHGLMVLGLIPLDVLAWFIPWSYSHLLFFLLRANRLTRVVYPIFYYQENNKRVNINIYFWRLTYVILTCTFVLHFLTCLLMVICCTHSPNMYPSVSCGRTKVTYRKKLTDYAIFLSTFIFCFTKSSQATVFPQSFLATGYCIMIMIVMQMMNSTITTHIYSTLQMGFNKQNGFAVRASRLRDYLEVEEASLSLVRNVWMYLRLLWQNQRGSIFPALLIEAPQCLREQVLNSAFGHHISCHPIFAKCHEDFNRQVCVYFKDHSFIKGDLVLFEGSLTGCMYFIHVGEVVAVKQRDGGEEVVGTLVSGQSFGVAQGLHPDVLHAFTYRCTRKSIILSLKFADWSYLLDFFPASKAVIEQKYQMYCDESAGQNVA